MNPLIIIYEDLIHRAILNRIIGDYTGARWIPKNGKTEIDKRTRSYINASDYNRVIVLRDLDRDASCAPEFLSTKGLIGTPSSFIYRLAVRTAEAWVMADSSAFSDYFRCRRAPDVRTLEAVEYPKDLLLQLVWNGHLSRARKDTIVKINSGIYKQSYSYNLELIRFIEEIWDIDIATTNSESLRKCRQAIDRIL